MVQRTEAPAGIARRGGRCCAHGRSGSTGSARHPRDTRWRAGARAAASVDLGAIEGARLHQAVDARPPRNLGRILHLAAAASAAVPGAELVRARPGRERLVFVRAIGPRKQARQRAHRAALQGGGRAGAVGGPKRAASATNAERTSGAAPCIAMTPPSGCRRSCRPRRRPCIRRSCRTPDRRVRARRPGLERHREVELHRHAVAEHRLARVGVARMSKTR